MCIDYSNIINKRLKLPFIHNGLIGNIIILEQRGTSLRVQYTPYTDLNGIWITV